MIETVLSEKNPSQEKKQRTRRVRGVAARAASSDVDLYIGHLLINTHFRSHSARESTDVWQPKNWYFRKENRHSSLARYVLKLQGFKKGGYEYTLRRLDLEAIANRLDEMKLKPVFKKSRSSDLPSLNPDDDKARSLRRAKKGIRLQACNIGVDNLMTLTVRETDSFLTRDQLKQAWQAFRQNCDRAGLPIGDYVAVPERHKKGNYHLHVAMVGFRHANTVRGCWNAALRKYGKDGNVDFSRQFWVQNKSGFERVARVAGYMSKYIAKTFQDEEQGGKNKKRYFVSKNELPPLLKLVLNGDDFESALHESAELLGLEVGGDLSKNHHPVTNKPSFHISGLRGHSSFYTDSSGYEACWFSFKEHCLKTPAPP